MTDREKYIKENSKLAIIMALEILAEYPAMVKCQNVLYEYNGKCYDMIDNQRLMEMFYAFCVKYGILAAWKGRNDVIQAINASDNIPKIDKMNDYEGLMCLNNGVLDINTRELKKHSHKFYFDSFVSVDYNPSETDCHSFTDYLNNTFNNDQDIVNNIIMLGGYLLDTSCKANRMFIFQGSGGNGKSILIDTFSMFFSDSMVRPQITSISLSDLSSDKFKKYDLITSRFNQCAEEKKGYIDAEEIKKIISGELINVAGKFKDTITFRPKTKIVVACNEGFKFTDQSDGISRRLVIVKFENQYRDPEEIKNIQFATEKHIYPWDLELPDKLRNEKSAIFNLFLNGLLMLKDRKYQFIFGSSLNKSLAEFRRDSDTVREFLEENYEIDLNASTPLQTVYLHYRSWYRLNVQDSSLMKFRANEMGRRLKEIYGIDSKGRETLYNNDTKEYEKVSVYGLRRVVVEAPDDFDIKTAIEAPAELTLGV